VLNRGFRVRGRRRPMAEELFPPEDLLRALHSPFREVRLGAIRELSGPEWLHHQDSVRAAAARTFCTAGSNMPIRIAMIAITTRSSMRVNAFFI